MCAAILNYTNDGGPKYFKHEMWLKDWFPTVPNGMVIKKRLHFTCIYGPYRKAKNVEGVQLPETALHKV